MSEKAREVQILVVDDDPDICDYMQSLLSTAGYSVDTNTNPTRAIEELRSQRYHLVVLDLMMPKVDGIELLRTIRRFDSDVAIVVLTGYPSVETAVHTLKQMSRRTGLSVSLLSQIERAESSASVSSLHKVARALNCRLTHLFGDF